MRLQITLRALFGWTTLLCAVAGSVLSPSPLGVLPLLLSVTLLLALWPWLFGHGG